MTDPTHCPYRQAALLQQALAPDKMRIAFLLGAGCPVAIRVPDGAEKNRPLIPDIRGLTEAVNQMLSGSTAHKANYDALLKGLSDGGPSHPTIEDILSYIRALQDVVNNGTIGGLNKTALAGLDKAICDFTTSVVKVSLPPEITPYHQLATWVGGVQRAHPIEIFTPNYDLLIEQALEAQKLPYFDGFVGSHEAFFDLTSMENVSPPNALPPRWSRLWKLHGSVNWWRTVEGEVVRRDSHEASDRQMIYPSHLKYDQSRRMPYLAMQDRLREFLGRGQAVLVTSGYSFADQHLNEVILHGLRSNPTAMCFGLLFGPRANYEDAFKRAQRHPNLSLLADDGAILGTIERPWRSDEQTGNPLHGTFVSKDATPATGGVHTGICRLRLGDFKTFGTFLARQLSRTDDDQVTA